MTSGQRRSVIWGIIWGLVSWIPYYTEYLSNFRGIIGIPAAIGLNLELILNKGDAFIFSIILGVGICFFTASLFDLFKAGVKIIGLFPYRKKKMLRRGL